MEVNVLIKKEDIIHLRGEEALGLETTLSWWRTKKGSLRDKAAISDTHNMSDGTEKGHLVRVDRG